MSKQIFKKHVPNQMLFNLLEQICLKEDNCYIIDLNSYRKMIFHEYHISFLEEMKPYYHLSKYFYVERQLTYNSFVNIVRQICKYNNIRYTSKIKYNESKYVIQYFVYNDQWEGSST